MTDTIGGCSMKRYGFGSVWTENTGHINVHVWDNEINTIYVSLRRHAPEALAPEDVPSFVRIVSLLNHTIGEGL